MYEGGTLVPACAVWPGVIPAEKTTSVRCATVDLFPTIGKICGYSLTSKDKRPIDGIDLMPVISGTLKTRGKDLFFGYRRLVLGVDGKAIISGNYKLMKEAKKNGGSDAMIWRRTLMRKMTTPKNGQSSCRNLSVNWKNWRRAAYPAETVPIIATKPSQNP